MPNMFFLGRNLPALHNKFHNCQTPFTCFAKNTSQIYAKIYETKYVHTYIMEFIMKPNTFIHILWNSL